MAAVITLQQESRLINSITGKTIGPDAGEQIEYTFTIENIGDETASGLRLDDDLILIEESSFTLPPSGKVTRQGLYTLEQSDIDNQTIDTETSVLDASNNVLITSENKQPLATIFLPNVTKLPKLFDGDLGRPEAGDQFVFGYEVTNNGNITLFNVVLQDDNGSPSYVNVPLSGLEDLDGDGEFDDLAVGKSATGELATVLTQSAIDQGEIRAETKLTANNAKGTQREATTPSELTLGQQPELEVTKAATVEDSEGQVDTLVDSLADKVLYNYTVTNTGNISLYDVVLTDDNGSPDSVNPDSVTIVLTEGLKDLDNDGLADDLAVGETAKGTYLANVTQAILDAGSVTNVVEAKGTGTNGQEVDDKATAVVEVRATPKIEVEKDVAILNDNGNGVAEVGETLQYTYLLTNTGNVSLRNVKLIDDNATPGDSSDDVTMTALSAQAAQGVATILQDDPSNGIPNDLFDADSDGQLDDLVVGGSVTATYTVEVTQEMVDRATANGGELTNIVVGEGTPPGSDDPITDDDKETVVTLVPDPGIKLTKFTSATAFSDSAALDVPADVTDAIEIAAGDDVYWIYAVENTGNVSFQPDQIVITDDNGTPSDASDDAAIAPTLIASTDDGNGTLDVGETWYYQAQGVAQDLSFEFDFDTEQAFNAGDDAATLNGFYGVHGLSISTPLVRGGEDAGNRAMIFDTANPTGEDFDLGTPHGTVGKGQGAGAGTGNDTALGNVLIISEDGDSSDPDDNADGGILQFDWAGNPVRLTEVSLLDIDRAEDVSIATAKDGSGIGTYTAQDLGDNSHQSVVLGGEWADQLAVNFEHSGAVSGLKGVGFYENTATVTAVFNGETLTDDAMSFYTNSIADNSADPTVTVSIPSTDTDPQDILFVTGSPDDAMDQVLQARLTDQGFNVMVQDDDQVQASDANEKDLVLISESVFSGNVGAMFTESDVAIMTWESYLYDDLGMAAEGDYGFVSGNAINVNGDALLAPSFSGETEVYESSGLLSWASPGSEAEVMATLADNSDQATIFAYSANATLVSGSSAPAKRVGFFAHNSTASPFTDDGLALFDAAVSYALS